MKPKDNINKQDLPVAIIGMGCFFPNSPGLKEYWRLIYHGEDAITDVPSTHWSATDYFDEDPKTPDHTYCKRGGFLSPIEFDPTEFGIPPNSLEATDSSQLLGLMAAKMALSDAGYGNGESFNRDRTSVILGVTGTQELVIPLSARLGYPKWRRALNAAGVPADTTEEVIRKIADSYVSWQENSFPGLLGNVVAGRICNRLDLGGTNCVVDAACASSMSAIHMALLELYAGRSDMVVTGGVDTLNDIFMHMCFSKTHILSPTGDARPFSKDADGTVLGEGIGILIFKRLEDAEKDGDKIYAVIRGIGSSSDGKSQSIYAPRLEGQAKALKMAYERAGVAPSSVTNIETHGTGTQVGDRVEFNALCQVFGNETSNGQKYAIGSVKSMIGHTKAAAGAAGLIKTALSLHHKIIPPTLKAENPDPELGIDKSPFYLNPQSRPWFSNEKSPRRSGVSSFGFGGSNFHVVLEEYQSQKAEIAWDGTVEIVALSAPSRDGLNQKLLQFKNRIANGATAYNFAAAAAETRQDFSHRDAQRLLWVFDRKSIPAEIGYDRLVQELRMPGDGHSASLWNRGNLFYGGPQRPGKLAFIFPGQGSQYPGMGHDLVCFFPEAFKVLQTADSIFGSTERLSDYIYPGPFQSNKGKKNRPEDLSSTEIAQPAIGALSLALLKVLEGFGVKPDATCGHSFGELTALKAAGWMNESAFFDLAVTRGRLMAKAGGGNGHRNGGMLAIKAPIDDIEKIIREHRLDVVLASKNSPDQGVVAGSMPALSGSEEIFHQKGFNVISLPVSAAFHSPLLDSAEKPFRRALRKITFSPTKIPVFSNTTTKPYPDDPIKAGELLAGHILNPVNFTDEIKNLFQSGVQTFVEVGPKSVLTGLVKSILKGENFQAIAMDRSAGHGSGVADLAGTLCHLSAAGYPVALNCWEAAMKEDRKPLMRIPISGANYTGQKKPSISSTAEIANNAETARHKKQTTSSRKADKTVRRAPEPPPAPQAHWNGTIETMQKEQDKNHPDMINRAMEVVHLGLQSMQSLQRQTAEAHQKFLETQKEASRTLRVMMESTRQLAEGTPGRTLNPLRPDTSEDMRHAEGTADLQKSAPAIVDTAREAKVSSLQIDTHSRQDTAAIAPGKSAIRPTDHEQQDAFSNRKELASTMLDVVSDLTGYPPEMINLDMDIEADLGIDSIKRVEILSTLEERMPDLPSISPEVMGKMKTLRQISELFTAAEPDASVSCNRPEANVDVVSSDTSTTSQQGLEANMLAVVSDLTGYPVDMIGLDMDIEADLGIDSIKRVEILSSLEEKMPELPSVSPEIMGSLKTLGQIAEYLRNGAGSHGTAPKAHPDDAPHLLKNDDRGCQNTAAETCQQSNRLDRKTVKIVEKQLNSTGRISLPSGRKCFITDDKSGLSEAIADELASNGINTVLISTDILSYKEALPPASGLVIVHSANHPVKSDDLKEAFRLTRNVGSSLIESASEDGAFFGTVSRLDGAFGFYGLGVEHPMQGALAGLVKTANIEWEAVRCHAIDVAPSWQDNPAIARAVVAELLNSDPFGPVEIGLAADKRCVLELASEPHTGTGRPPDGLDAGDVVVVSGGARGVTAAAARALATTVNPTLVLLGRSPSPAQVPSWLRPHEDETAMKKAILDNEFGGKKTSPQQLEAAFKKHRANREILNTLKDIESAGARTAYYSVDVRDADNVSKILADVRKQHGPIKALIHGAGVLEDRLILDKKMAQFERVFDTKVAGLKALLKATEKDPLKYLVIFSSVTARQGNKGQADYAMANETLNKMAQQFAALRPETRVVAINWGPWDGGMVTPALKKEFERNGIALIQQEQGVGYLLDEMMDANRRHAEVVIGNGFNPEAEIRSPCSKNDRAAGKAPEGSIPGNGFTLTFKREIDVQRYPILRSHVLDGKPVVPLALMAEWFGHGALHENPGLHLHGLNDMRVLQGIKLDQGKREIRLLAGKARKQGPIFEVNLELRDGYLGNVEVVHSRAKALLVTSLTKAPDYTPPAKLDKRNYSRPIREVYDEILFHGTDLQGIREISHLSADGMTAQILPAPEPSRWMKEPLRNRWLSDPLVLDSAFQMATVWCYEQQGAVSLPSYCATYRQYRNTFPDDGVIAVLEIKDSSAHKMKGDFTFLDAGNEVVATMFGFEAVMDPSLYRAFKPEYTRNPSDN